MSEQGTAIMAPTTGAGNGTETNSSAAPSGNPAESFYAGTYKSREDAEKGIREKELAVNRAFAERDNANKQIAELTATLRKVAEGRVPERVAPVIDREALAKEVDEKGGKGVLDVLEKFARETDAEYDRRLAEVTKNYDAKLGEITKSLRDRDPEYLQNREKVVEMAERMGLDPDQHRDLLMKVVREVGRNASPGRPDLPGNSAAPNIARSIGSPTMDPSALAMLESVEGIGKLTPDEIKRAATIRADTVERRRAVRT
jgi:hypothetical protein